MVIPLVSNICMFERECQEDDDFDGDMSTYHLCIGLFTHLCVDACINVSMYDGDNNIDQPPSACLATTLRPMNAVPPQRISIDIFPLISESLKDLEDTVLVYLKHTASWGLRKKTVPVFYRVVWEHCVHVWLVRPNYLHLFAKRLCAKTLHNSHHT